MRNMGTRVPSLDVYQTCDTVNFSGSTSNALLDHTERAPVFKSSRNTVGGVVNDVNEMNASRPSSSPLTEAAPRPGSGTAPLASPESEKSLISVATSCRYVA